MNVYKFLYFTRGMFPILPQIFQFLENGVLRGLGGRSRAGTEGVSPRYFGDSS